MDRVNWILQIAFNVIACIHAGNSNIKLPAKTNFSCLDKAAGFYADVDANCRIYHTCDEYGNKFTYHCPVETAFRQDALICDHVHLVLCQRSTAFITENNVNTKQRANSSYMKGSVDDTNSLLSLQPFVVTQQSAKTNNKMQHGFAFGSNIFFNRFNNSGINENTMKSFIAVANTFNSTKESPNVHFKSNRMQYTPLTNQSHRSGLSKVENDNIKFNKEQSNQNNYLNQKMSNTSNNYLKSSPSTFFESVQENNVNNHQNVRNFGNFLKPPSANHRNYPYSETLKSIQRSSKFSSSEINTTRVNVTIPTTEVPVYALTLSLEPLVPHELEYDPYYPKYPTSTEAYYTPSLNKKKLPHRVSTETTWFKKQPQLPSILPDLTSLEDIVDRRKLYYISKVKSS